MRSFYGPDQFLLTSKKPRIIELVARSKTMTIDEIKSLDEKSDIIKGLLIINELGEGKATVFEKIANKMNENVKVHDLIDYNNYPCKIYRFNQNTWVKARASEYEIREGEYWAKTDRDIWVSNHHMPLDDILIDNVNRVSDFVMDGEMRDLFKLDVDRRSKL